MKGIMDTSLINALRCRIKSIALDCSLKSALKCEEAWKIDGENEATVLRREAIIYNEIEAELKKAIKEYL